VNENEELVKTVFTKSIKNRIDNINIEEDSTISNKKPDNDKINNIKSHQDSIMNFTDNENGNLISESILLMINEVKDYKKKICKRKTATTIINRSKKINLNNLENNNSNNNHKLDKYSSIMSSYKTLIINKNKNNIYKYQSKNNKSKLSTISKANTYMGTSKNFNSIEKLVYSPKSKKAENFLYKKEM